MNLNFQSIAKCVHTGIIGVVDQSQRPKHAADALLEILRESLEFKVDPIGYHLREMEKRIVLETSLAPAYIDIFPPIQIDLSVTNCTRSRCPVQHVHAQLRIGILSKIIYFGFDESIQNAARQIESHCPITWERSDAPFVDDPLCHCKNCKRST